MLSPPKLSDLTCGVKLIAGLGESTVLADIDFETYSPAGYHWNSHINKWEPLPGARSRRGLSVVGAARYTEHPEAEVLSCAYDLKNGKGPQLWIPSKEPPFDLFSYLFIQNGLIESWNAAFEYWVWNNICVKKYGWPKLSFEKLRCAMAKARAHALPGSLAEAGRVLNVSAKKDKNGKRLLQKFSIPKNPTKHSSMLRISPSEDKEDGELLHKYNIQDIRAEAEVSSLIPDLSDAELSFWQCDHLINTRGIKIDLKSIDSCISIIEQVYESHNQELAFLTDGQVCTASKVAQLVKWLKQQGLNVKSLTSADVTSFLSLKNIDIKVRRVLEIRAAVSSAAVKKLYAMKNQVTLDGRLHDLFVYHSARTGRAAGSGPQPQNLPRGGLDLTRCRDCKKHFYDDPQGCCSWCTRVDFGRPIVKWNNKAVEDVLEIINYRFASLVNYYFKDVIGTVSGCLRGMFISDESKNLICSDYSAIEAVVLAELSGETWRQDVFRTHGKIYEMSASMISGVPFETIIQHKEVTGDHHRLRNLGKVAELASGYQGWIGAWKNFKADQFLNEEQIKKSILAWRKASPKIVEFWGGQERNWKHEFYGLEGMAVSAVINPGQEFSYRGITYIVKQDILYCRLLSGRYLTYHKPRLAPNIAPRKGLALSFEGWNSNPKKGGMGWIRINTYGGMLCENVVQATARDILMHAILNLEKNNYPVVLHIHDEIVSEIPENYGSLEEFEKIMSTMPTWAEGWPVKASGGWIAKRYSK